MDLLQNFSYYKLLFILEYGLKKNLILKFFFFLIIINKLTTSRFHEK